MLEAAHAADEQAQVEEGLKRERIALTVRQYGENLKQADGSQQGGSAGASSPGDAIGCLLQAPDLPPQLSDLLKAYMAGLAAQATAAATAAAEAAAAAARAAAAPPAGPENQLVAVGTAVSTSPLVTPTAPTATLVEELRNATADSVAEAAKVVATLQDPDGDLAMGEDEATESQDREQPKAKRANKAAGGR